MKKFLALLTSCAMLLTGCSICETADSSSVQSSITTTKYSEDIVTEQEENPQNEATETILSEDELILTDKDYIESLGFDSLDDPDLLSFIEDAVYSDLVTQLDSENYLVENVEAVYISKEYLEESAYNSQSNIYFGYTLDELNEAFEGEQFIFTLGDNGQTTVEVFEEYDDTYDKVIRNVAVGTGVILICVTVSVATGGAGAPAVSMVFAASAKAGSIGALTGGAFGGATTFMTFYVQTGDAKQAAKESMLSASEGYMWGAIGGAVSGGASEAIALKGATLNGLTMNEAALIQKESIWPLDVIKNLNSKQEADILIKANLEPCTVNGKKVLVRKIDWDIVDEFGRTNRQRVSEFNLSPLGSDGNPLEIHHIGRKADGPFAILTKSEHHSKENYAALHYAEEGKNITNTEWNKQRIELWKQILKLTGGK